MDSLATLLAVTACLAAAPGARIADVPGAGVAIASWERGGERRVAISLDGGATWGPSEPMTYDIALRAGAPRDPGARLSASGLYVVQLETKSLGVFRRALRDLGAELLAYVPHHAWIARMEPSVAASVRAQPYVRLVVPYDAAMKVDPAIVAEREPRRYHVSSFLPGPAGKAAIAREVRAAGGSVIAAIPEGYRLEAMLSDQQLAAVAASPHVAWIDRWSAPETDMDLVRAECGAAEIETVAGFSGQGVRGEVMDCGIMAAHPDLDGKTVHGPAPSECDHGTAVYGILFGNGDRDGDGDARATGVLPSAQGYFFDYDGLVNRYEETAELVSPAIGAVFQSNSWGSARSLSYTSASQELDEIVWEHDIAIFQSQSNNGTQESRPEAWAKNVISVGGTYHWDTPTKLDDCWCRGSSIGPAEDGRIKPDLTHWYDFIYCTDLEPGGYKPGLYTPTFNGTSASTPIAAGVGGLFFQMWAAGILGNDPRGATVFERRPHAMTLKALLVNTAEAYPFSGAFAELSRMKQGWGLPSAKNLYDRRERIRVVNQEHLLRELEEHVYDVTVPAGEAALKVTLAYLDRPGTPASAIHRVNDVSLVVVDPAGVTKYHGNNGLTEGNWSVPGGSADHRNTVENVFVPDPAAGTWTVRVIAEEINVDEHRKTPEDDQDYALVVSGVSAMSFRGVPAPRSVPEDSLTLARDGDDLLLTWGKDCGGTSLASIYRGDLAAGYESASHVACAVEGSTLRLPAGPGSSFFLVAPSDGWTEGSLGTTREGPRPQPSDVCAPRAPEAGACSD